MCHRAVPGLTRRDLLVRNFSIPDSQQVLPLPQFTLESLEEIPKAYDRVAEGKVRFRPIITPAT